MKTSITFKIVFVLVFILTSCSTTVEYFQVYKAKPVGEMVANENSLRYEDENCIVYYNFWSDGGDMGFRFYNKTDESIYLDLDNCFFIRNGYAYNYYKNRVYTSSSSIGENSTTNVTASKSVTGVNNYSLIQTSNIIAEKGEGSVMTASKSISYNEEKVICIPSKSSKNIIEYNIAEFLYRDCDLLLYPNKKNIRTKKFSNSDSPLVFGNRISYSVSKTGKPYKFENEFYVSEITNYPSGEFLVLKNEENCGQKSLYFKQFFKNTSPDNFYLKYILENSIWIH